MKSPIIKKLGLAAVLLTLGAAIGCGGEDEVQSVVVNPPSDSDQVLARETEDVVIPAEDAVIPTADGDGVDDEVILPEASSQPEPEAPEIEAPKAPPAALTVSLAGSKTLYETKSDLLKISYGRKGGGDVQQFYIYGPFSDDADCDGGLVIDPSGNKLNEGSPNYLKYQHLLSGEMCKDLEGNCRDFYALEAPGTFCRIELPAESGTFYTRIHQNTAKYVLVGEAGDGTFEKAEVSFKMPPPKQDPAPKTKIPDSVAYAPWAAAPASSTYAPWAADPCGDGKVDADEACDDGNATPGDGCYRCKVDNGWNCQALLFETKSTCTRFNFECGDGALEERDGEQCDDKNDNPNDGCYNCVIQPGWDCSYSMFTFTNTCWKI